MPRKREVGAVACCLVCDSFFLLVLATVPPLSHFSGRKGTAELELLLHRLQSQFFALSDSDSDSGCGVGSDTGSGTGSKEQCNGSDSAWDELQYAAFLPSEEPAVTRGDSKVKDKISSKKIKKSSKKTVQQKKSSAQEAAGDPVYDRKVHMLPCPTCAKCLLESSSDALSTTSSVEQIESLGSRETIFSPCLYFSFAEDYLPPLYLDSQNSPVTGKKPKWTLASGVGPAVLELDSSRTGRVYKPSLRPLLGMSRCIPFERWLEAQDWSSCDGLVDEAAPNTWEAKFSSRHRYISDFWERVGRCDLCGERSQSKLKECSSNIECLLHLSFWMESATGQTSISPHRQNDTSIIWLTFKDFDACVREHELNPCAVELNNFLSLKKVFERFLVSA